MISANELRIGNWVDAKGHGPLQMKPHILSYVIRGTFPIGDYSPIPLTPEILEKAGFKEATPNYFKGDTGFIHKNESGLDDQFSDDMGAYIFNVWYKEGYGTHQAIAELKYLHQLQNLIFALTQTELTIDL